jgi:hypothetical protein
MESERAELEALTRKGLLFIKLDSLCRLVRWNNAIRHENRRLPY